MKWIKRIAIGLVCLVVLVYAAGIAGLYFLQRDYQYSPSGEIVPLQDTSLVAQEIAIPTEGGAMLAGWYARPVGGQPVILYYKGNSGSFSEENERYAAFTQAGYGFLAFDYRGFPATPGTITEASILADSLAAFDWLAAQGYPIAIWGRSLGTGAATYVASERDADALLLESPFLSAVNVAAERYWYAPVYWLMLDTFRSDERIARVTEPVFIAHGTADETIGVSNGERLYALAPNPAELWIEEGGTHGDLWARGIWGRAEHFFETTEAAK